MWVGRLGESLFCMFLHRIWMQVQEGTTACTVEESKEVVATWGMQKVVNDTKWADKMMKAGMLSREQRDERSSSTSRISRFG